MNSWTSGEREAIAWLRFSVWRHCSMLDARRSPIAKRNHK